jgi:gas vesicle protein
MKKFIFGALVGAGIALLYAPASGARTRSLLRDKSKKLANDTTDMIESKSRHLKNKMEGVKAKARNLADKVKESLPSGDHTRTTEQMEREPAWSGMEPSI